MRNVIALEHIKKELQATRRAIHDNIIDLLKEHNVKDVTCCHLCDCPVIHDGICDDDIMTLDTIVLYDNGNCEYIIFEGSGEYNNGNVTAFGIDLERLISVYEWILENKEDLFDNED